MEQQIKSIVIVGGGTAGWLTAAILAADHNVDQGQLLSPTALNITLVESPDVATIGVGEGTWPSMRHTLQHIGISETEFINSCDASFKQGSQFNNWCTNSADTYLHPFSLPVGIPDFNICPYWLPFLQQVSFADAVNAQARLSLAGLAPKQISTAEYSFINNYGYHLDAGKFSNLLQQHATSKLGVQHVKAHIAQIRNTVMGNIDAIITTDGRALHADLFIDCSGAASMLLGQHLAVPFIQQKQVLFNDSALAVQLPYPQADAAIASCTQSTAQPNGWVWDIGLQSRRGVGHVYSSAHCSDDQAEQQLRHYLQQSGAENTELLTLRKLSFNPGHYARCWQKNCVAIGMAAGFIEPLEASALALVEWSAKYVSAQLPLPNSLLSIAADRMNQAFNQHWQQIIEFLKLHYVLSKRRDHDYWHDHRESSSIPPRLQHLLQFWQHKVPSNQDITHSDVLFPAASYQYILYGMGFETQQSAPLKPSQQKKAQALFEENIKRVQQLAAALPPNRQLLDKIRQYGLPPI
ncbi:tryptophan halogenase family protein [Rheinheimera baltica]|uniref:tryptophan halogenase family protein n=1 Tax=Rheinheimera baltica TaxID=67576 RepID=UPI00273E1A90|nr:tryptophan halogenase family protein [Rheinheimera baltica]MDP5150928.1 tryptophan 7-halogenase [Rheinheimera baltica]